MQFLSKRIITLLICLNSSMVFAGSQACSELFATSPFYADIMGPYLSMPRVRGFLNLSDAPKIKGRLAVMVGSTSAGKTFMLDKFVDTLEAQAKDFISFKGPSVLSKESNGHLPLRSLLVRHSEADSMAFMVRELGDSGSLFKAFEDSGFRKAFLDTLPEGSVVAFDLPIQIFGSLRDPGNSLNRRNLVALLDLAAEARGKEILVVTTMHTSIFQSLDTGGEGIDAAILNRIWKIDLDESL